jgi:hypothetical protein
MKNTDIRGYLKFIFCIIVLYAFYNIIGIGCQIRFLTGVSCAGCGMTRAWIYLFHLDIKGAFHFHPLFILPVIYLPILLFKRYIPKKIFFYAIVIGVFLFIATYIFRILNPDDVVNINIENGFIYKVLKFIQSGGN